MSAIGNATLLADALQTWNGGSHMWAQQTQKTMTRYWIVFWWGLWALVSTSLSCRYGLWSITHAAGRALLA